MNVFVWSQLRKAAEIMAQLNAYAMSIGCTVFQDSIEVHTDEQGRLLAEWWATNTTPKSGDGPPASVNPSADKGSPK